MITSSAKITQQTLVDVGDMVNVINSINWLVTIDDGTRVTHHAGRSDLQAPAGSFIPFMDVTEAQKFEWIFMPYNGLDAFAARIVTVLQEASDQISYDIPAPPPVQDTFKVRKVSV
jgi:hypothetical protein